MQGNLLVYLRILTVLRKVKIQSIHILVHRFGENGYVSYDQIEKNHSFIKEWKVLVPKASPGDDSYPHLILSKPILSGPDTCCTETYIVVVLFSKKRAKNAANYMVTSFFAFLWFY